MTSKSKWYTCPLCPQWAGCSSAAGFHRHNFKHDPASQFKCDICGKIFLGKNDHNRHMRSHESTRDKPFICSCGKDYMSNQALLKHFRTEKVRTFRGMRTCLLFVFRCLVLMEMGVTVEWSQTRGGNASAKATLQEGLNILLQSPQRARYFIV